MTAEPFARQLVALESRGRLRRLIPRSGRDFASNDYLGLSGDPPGLQRDLGSGEGEADFVTRVAHRRPL